MEQKFTKRMLFITLGLAVLNIVRIIDQKGIEDIRGIYILSLMACGFTIGAFVVSLIVFIRSKKNK
jgi:hypothetical protein